MVKTIFEKETEGCGQDDLQLSMWELHDKQLVIELPEGFEEMDEERKEENYPLSGRPEMIVEDGEGKVQITFQFFQKVMGTEETRDVTDQIRELMESAYVQYQTSQIYLDTDGEIPVGWFLMHMNDIEKEHIKAVFSIKKHMVLLTLTYPIEENWKWRVAKDYIFASIKEGNHGTGFK